MIEIHNASRFERIEAEARKVPPLSYVLLLLAIATGPFWISAIVVAVSERAAVQPADDFYNLVHEITSGGTLISFVAAAATLVRTVKRRTRIAKDFTDLSSFQLGWGAVRTAWQGW